MFTHEFVPNYIKVFETLTILDFAWWSDRSRKQNLVAGTHYIA